MIKIAKDSPSPEPNIVAQKITETQQYKEAQIVICYIALKSEIDISLVADIAIKDNKQVVFVGETPGILNIADENWKDNIIKLNNKTETIISSKVLNIKQRSSTLPQKGIILVPGLAFTKFGTRLGRGAGYYDELLHLTKNIYSIGICKKAQLLEELPTEPHDCKVDVVFDF